MVMPMALTGMIIKLQIGGRETPLLKGGISDVLPHQGYFFSAAFFRA